MKELKKILLKWLDDANKAATCNRQGVGISFHNEDARIKSRVLTQVLQQINKRQLKLEE